MPVEAPPAPTTAAPTIPSGPVSTLASNMGDAMSKLTGLGGGGDKLPVAPQRQSEPPAKAPEKAAAAPEAKKADVVPPEKPAVTPPAKTEPDISKFAPKQLREAYEKRVQELSVVRKELEELKTAPKSDPEKVKLTEQLATYQKRVDEAEAELRFTKYESTAEYKNQYWEPYVDAYATARAQMPGLKVTDADGNVRGGTPEDFDLIAGIADNAAAADKAHEMFGNAASIVLQHRYEVQKLNAVRLKALDKFRAEGAERQKKQAEEQANSQKALAELWQNENKAALEKHPEWFQPVEGDVEGNAKLERGYALADAAFSGGMIKDDKTGEMRRMTNQEQVKLHSAIRNKAAAFDRLAHTSKKDKARIAELETKLKEFEESEPPVGGGKSGQAKGEVNTLDSALSGLDKYRNK